MAVIPISYDLSQMTTDVLAALIENDRPVVVEVVTDPDEMCFPMIPAGGSNDYIAMGPEDL